MADEWFVRVGKMELGPLTRRHLDGMVRRSELDPDSPVRRGDKGAWRPANTVPGLFDQPADDEEVGAKKGAKSPGKAASSKSAKGDDLSKAAREASASKPEPTPAEELAQFWGELNSSWAPWAIVLGAVAMLVTARWPSWYAGAGHYAGLIAIVAGISVYVQQAYEDSKLVMAAFWLAAVVVVGAWGWFDTCIENTVSQDNVAQRDTVRRFSRAVIHRERNHKGPGVEFRTWGPTLPDGKAHGRWETHWIAPAENNSEPYSWYWHGQPVTEEDWQSRQSAS